MARFDNPDFERLAESLCESLECVSARSFSLVFDGELPVTVGLHPNDTAVSIDVWCCDLEPQAGAQRRLIVNALLRLNHAAWPGQSLRLAMDSRGFVLLHGQREMTRLGGDAFPGWLMWHVEQGRRVRDLSRSLALSVHGEVARFAGC